MKWKNQKLVNEESRDNMTLRQACNQRIIQSETEMTKPDIINDQAGDVTSYNERNFRVHKIVLTFALKF